MAKPTPSTEARFQQILEILGNSIRTVRNITYKLYPKLHGKELDRKYNTITKDLVKLRTSGRIQFKQIKEVRTHLSNPIGYKNENDFITQQEIHNLELYYHQDRKPSHIKPFEIWYEKETIADDIENICREYDVPSLTIRGKPQWSTLKKASTRLTDKHQILYFGDNDKIGHQIYETTKDYMEYLKCECTFHWKGITEEQEQKYKYLPQNARLDGLNTTDLQELIRKTILDNIHTRTLNDIIRQEGLIKHRLKNYKLKMVKK